MQAITAIKSPAQQITEQFVDLEGCDHTLSFDTGRLLIDQQPAVIVGVNEDSISLRLPEGSVTISPEAFWMAFMGECEPTRSDAGMLLAQNIARWSFEQRQASEFQALLEELRRLVGLSQDFEALCLPCKRLDPYTTRVLDAFDGTSRSVDAIAFILDQPHSRIVEILEKAGKQMREIQEEPPLLAPSSGEAARREGDNETSAQSGEAHRNPERSAQTRRHEYFEWTSERVQLLQQTFAVHAPLSPSLKAIARTVAAELGCSWKAADYKVRALGLADEWKQTRAQQSAAPAGQEEQPTEASFSLKGDPVGEAEAGTPLTADTEAPSISLEEGPRQWKITGIQGRIAKETPRWGLSYPFGTFPLKAGNCISFRKQQYRLEEVGDDSLRVSPL